MNLNIILFVLYLKIDLNYVVFLTILSINMCENMMKLNSQNLSIIQSLILLPLTAGLDATF